MLESGLCDGSGAGLRSARRKAGHRRTGSLHDRHEPAFAAGHAEARHGAFVRVRPPRPARRPSPAAARTLPDRNGEIEERIERKKQKRRTGSRKPEAAGWLAQQAAARAGSPSGHAPEFYFE